MIPFLLFEITNGAATVLTGALCETFFIGADPILGLVGADPPAVAVASDPSLAVGADLGVFGVSADVGLSVAADSTTFTDVGC